MSVDLASNSASGGSGIVVIRYRTDRGANPPARQKVALLSDTKGDVDGGSSVVGWQQRDLNTINFDTIGVTLANDAFTLPAGFSYKIRASAPAYISRQHIIALSVNGGPYVLGTTEYNIDTGNIQTRSLLDTAVDLTLSTEDTICTIHHYVRTQQNNNGLGVRSVDLSNSVYTVVAIERLEIEGGIPGPKGDKGEKGEGGGSGDRFLAEPSLDSATAPGFAWTGDDDTGIYHAGSNVLALATGGVERLRIDQEGDVTLQGGNVISNDSNADFVVSAQNSLRLVAGASGGAASNVVIQGHYDKQQVDARLGAVLNNNKYVTSVGFDFETMEFRQDAANGIHHPDDFVINAANDFTPDATRFALSKDDLPRAYIIPPSTYSVPHNLTLRIHSGTHRNYSNYIEDNQDGTFSIVCRDHSNVINVPILGLVFYEIAKFDPTSYMLDPGAPVYTQAETDALLAGERAAERFLADPGSDSAAAPGFAWTGDQDTGMFHAGSNVLALATGGQERMRLDASGNVGIRTDAPQSALHVNGDLRTSNVTVDGTLTANNIANHDTSSEVTQKITTQPGFSPLVAYGTFLGTSSTPSFFTGPQWTGTNLNVSTSSTTSSFKVNRVATGEYHVFSPDGQDLNSFEYMGRCENPGFTLRIVGSSDNSHIVYQSYDSSATPADCIFRTWIHKHNTPYQF